jgi:hypothetical protein
MRELLSISAGVLAVVSSLPYILNTAKGKTHPNLVTWLTWTIINGINTVLAWKVGAFPTEIIAGSSAIATITIVCLALRKGTRRYTPFDIVCQALALAGIVVWLATDRPTLGAVITTAVSLLVAVPTWQHAWKAPLHETWETFALGAAANFLTLLSLTTFGLVAVASPMTFLLSDIFLTGVILLRCRRLLRRTVADIPAGTAVA